MGKWTLNHTDDVLRDKVKNLVVGAIKRARLEKGEPTITYETFVEELDVGDSFTATLIDALVKEAAERRTRPNPTDRRLISERTAKTLRMQASASHIYRERSRLATRRYPADYIFSPDHEHSEDDEDETVEMLEAAESSRTAPALYDAYTFRPPATRSFVLEDAAQASMLRETVTSPRPLSPPTAMLEAASSSIPAFYLASPGSSSSLTRSRTVRRPNRTASTRTTDFSDFTSRRRSIVRANVESSESVRAEDSADGTWRFSLLDRAASSPHDGPSTSPSRPDRDSYMVFPHEEERVDAGEPPSSGSMHQSSSRPWYSHTGRASPSSDRTIAPMPRLRRGGLRAPESMLSHLASPSTETSSPRAGSPLRPLPPINTGAYEPEDSGTSRASGSGSSSSGRVQNEMDALDEASRQLLTPRSISPVGDVYHI
ncbi:uncharacterized protein PHACADRAFT_249338 [Phanerochaete carnosa HHB-10118-sp]|uniref:Uncharacterized protein n=1 Tax=Phanerochaete carnosa (strain HHB-10118-sp) TaxID=650164 RepID=K5X8A3_PHACS|nr:uncharacterized protein PHACADRAFT_249338 [Phanerochaete carnosa HHB-10118-sp]EKM59112.1 hypothetical protein PHACADRAFT_249338 [Phanerochaete carnosa HHB-10118-sp]